MLNLSAVIDSGRWWLQITQPRYQRLGIDFINLKLMKYFTTLCDRPIHSVIFILPPLLFLIQRALWLLSKPWRSDEVLYLPKVTHRVSTRWFDDIEWETCGPARLQKWLPSLTPTLCLKPVKSKKEEGAYKNDESFKWASNSL